jgi:hypothetical protein
METTKEVRDFFEQHLSDLSREIKKQNASDILPDQSEIKQILFCLQDPCLLQGDDDIRLFLFGAAFFSLDRDFQSLKKSQLDLRKTRSDLSLAKRRSRTCDAVLKKASLGLVLNPDIYRRKAWIKKPPFPEAKPSLFLRVLGVTFHLKLSQAEIIKRANDFVDDLPPESEAKPYLNLCALSLFHLGLLAINQFEPAFSRRLSNFFGFADNRSRSKHKAKDSSFGLRSTFVYGKNLVITSSKSESSPLSQISPALEEPSFQKNPPDFEAISWASEDKTFLLRAADGKGHYYWVNSPFFYPKRCSEAKDGVGMDYSRNKIILERDFYQNAPAAGFEDNIHIQLIYAALGVEKSIVRDVTNAVFTVNNLLKSEDEKESESSANKESDFLGNFKWNPTYFEELHPQNQQDIAQEQIVAFNHFLAEAEVYNAFFQNIFSFPKSKEGKANKKKALERNYDVFRLLSFCRQYYLHPTEKGRRHYDMASYLHECEEEHQNQEEENSNQDRTHLEQDLLEFYRKRQEDFARHELASSLAIEVVEAASILKEPYYFDQHICLNEKTKELYVDLCGVRHNLVWKGVPKSFLTKVCSTIDWEGFDQHPDLNKNAKKKKAFEDIACLLIFYSLEKSGCSVAGINPNKPIDKKIHDAIFSKELMDQIKSLLELLTPAKCDRKWINDGIALRKSGLVGVEDFVDSKAPSNFTLLIFFLTRFLSQTEGCDLCSVVAAQFKNIAYFGRVLRSLNDSAVLNDSCKLFSYENATATADELMKLSDFVRHVYPHYSYQRASVSASSGAAASRKNQRLSADYCAFADGFNLFIRSSEGAFFSHDLSRSPVRSDAFPAQTSILLKQIYEMSEDQEDCYTPKSLCTQLNEHLLVRPNSFNDLLKFVNPRDVRTLMDNEKLLRCFFQPFLDPKNYHQFKGEYAKRKKLALKQPFSREDSQKMIDDLLSAFKLLDFHHLSSKKNSPLWKYCFFYVEVADELVSSLMEINSRFASAWNSYQRDYSIAFPENVEDKPIIYNGSLTDQLFSVGDSSRNLSDHYSQKARNVLEEAKKEYDQVDALMDGRGSAAFRNFVDHLGLIPYANKMYLDSKGAAFEAAKGYPTLYDFYVYVLESYLLSKDRSFTSDIGDNSILQKYRSDLSAYKTASRDFMHVISYPFGYCYARYQNLVISKLFNGKKKCRKTKEHFENDDDDD